MTRNIADLTDDEIVDAIASFGVDGLYNGDPYPGNAFDAFMAKLDLRRAMQSDYDPANEIGAKLLVQSVVEKLERLTKLEAAAGNVVAKQRRVDRNKILRGSRLKQLLRRAVRNRAVRELGELLDRP